MRRWQNSPRYQRALQKIAALQPHHRAILQTVSADPQFAAEKMRKGIQSMITRTSNDSRERNFTALQKERGRRNAMADRSLSYDKGQGKKALALSLGNLGLSTYGGIKQRERDKKIMDQLEKMNARYDLAGTNKEIREMDRLKTLGIHRYKNYQGDYPNYLDAEQ